MRSGKHKKFFACQIQATKTSAQQGSADVLAHPSSLCACGAADLPAPPGGKIGKETGHQKKRKGRLKCCNFRNVLQKAEAAPDWRYTRSQQQQQPHTHRKRKEKPKPLCSYIIRSAPAKQNNSLWREPSHSGQLMVQIK